MCALFYSPFFSKKEFYVKHLNSIVKFRRYMI